MINWFDPIFLNSILRFVTPILLAALGGLWCQRVGVFNIALEGLILVGAFAAVVGSYYAQSAFVGILTAMFAGALCAGIFAVLVVRLRADEIVVALALNLLIAGLTVFLLRSLFQVKGVLRDPRIVGLDTIKLPWLEDVSIIGPFLSGHTSLTYLALLLVMISHWVMFYHRWGLRVRGVGEKPQAAQTLGVSATKTRGTVIIISGMLCALGGAQLALGNVTLFVENMSAGRGWIAVVAVMLGQAHAFAVFLASLLFGFVDSLSFRLQGLGLVAQLTEALPYLMTLVSLIIIALRRKFKSLRQNK